MPKLTAFHDRLESLNQTRIWKNWSGYLVAPNYQYSIASEYYAIRNSVSLLDTSPLFKYRFSGENVNGLLERVLARDIRKCKTGQAQYTTWCNQDGYVLQDGVALRISENELWLTAAEPALRFFRKSADQFSVGNVEIHDISTDYGILALQGPHAFNVLRQLTSDVAALDYFSHTHTTIDTVPVVVSRTGFTGDLGFEIWIPCAAAHRVWDALIEAGEPYNLTPIGTTALKMARMEAGLLLMDVDFRSAKHAWVDEQRETPIELGWSWMFRSLENDDREFTGRSIIEEQLTGKSGRWVTVGLDIDWHDYERVHLEKGIPAPKSNVYRETTMSIYRRGEKEWDYAGYASSFLFSSLLKRPIAIAKVPRDLATPGTEVDLEIPLIRQPANVLARVCKLPFYSPKRKTARLEDIQ